MSDVKAGYLAKVEISSGNQILGAGNWSYSGEVRDTHESTHFNTSGYKIDTPLMISGGEITISGDFRLNDISGRDAIDAAFRAGTELRDFRLYVDGNSYYTPDDTLFTGESTTGSYVVITKAPSTASFDTAGVGTMEFTAKVTGALLLVNASSEVIVQTIGRVEDSRVSDVTMLGKLLSLGDPSHNSEMLLKFQYGTTKLLGSETEYMNSVSDLGYFGIWTSDIITDTEIIYYRAVATGSQDGSKIGFGAVLSDVFHSEITTLST